jgi:hypothetical protein
MMIESAATTKKITRAASKAQKQMDYTTGPSHTSEKLLIYSNLRSRHQNREEMIIEEKEITYEKKSKIKVAGKEFGITPKRQNAMLLEENDDSV